MTTKIHRSALVLHSAKAMFDLVNDVRNYPQFLPWCVGARILSEQPELLEASLDLSRGGVSQSFTTRNRLEPGKAIHMELVDGPFSKLVGSWRFQALAHNACKVMLELEFEFANKMLAATVGPVFGQVSNTMVDTFCRRAKDIYG